MRELNFENHDDNDPSPWLALFLDQSVPMVPEVKAAYLEGKASWTRQYLLPVLRPFLYLLVGVFQIFKILTPKSWSAPLFLHKFIVFCLKRFVRPEANYLILRHFHLGTQVIQFLCRNLDVPETIQKPLFPKRIEDLRDNLFVQHDINLYNFVIHMNKQYRDQGRRVKAKPDIDFSAVQDVELKLEDFPNGRLNFIDLETAIEMIGPFFQLFISDTEYWRASISLQLDETIGVYMATLLNKPERLFFVNNKHPLCANNVVEAPRRLVLHGLSTEMVHASLLELKAMKTLRPKKTISREFVPTSMELQDAPV